MTSPFHPGEVAVQSKAGVRTEAAHVGAIIRDSIALSAAAFLSSQRFAIAGFADEAGNVWASLLSGEVGALRAIDPARLLIAMRPVESDPLAAALARAAALGRPAELGLLVIDLVSRKRLRLNGVAEPAPDGRFLLHVREAYWNCPKYIQKRQLDTRAVDASMSELREDAVAGATQLTAAQRALVSAADTFFIASVAPDGRADASHRGGEPGFVRLHDDAGGVTLVFPDYSGNNMFNTFGNLAVNPAAGLLFLDFARGAALQLTGRAEVLWDPADYAGFPGAERAARFRITDVVEQAHATPLRWQLVERSPFNPPAPRAT